MSETFDFFTSGSIENKLAVILSWHADIEDYDDAADAMDDLAGLIRQIPAVLNGGDRTTRLFQVRLKDS